MFSEEMQIESTNASFLQIPNNKKYFKKYKKRLDFCLRFGYNTSCRLESCPSWSKEHDWKSCNRQKRFVGSNPMLSAKNVRILRTFSFYHKKKTALGAYTRDPLFREAPRGAPFLFILFLFGVFGIHPVFRNKFNGEIRFFHKAFSVYRRQARRTNRQ